MVTIPSDILKTNTTDGYFKYFYLLRGDFPTNEETYYHIETTREHYGLGKRYSTFDGFKMAKSRYDNKPR